MIIQIIGLPGSGKTTLAKALKETDKMRKKIRSYLVSASI